MPQMPALHTALALLTAQLLPQKPRLLPPVSTSQPSPKLLWQSHMLALQAQLKLPGLFVQSMPWPQPLPPAHSSMSLQLKPSPSCPALHTQVPLHWAL